MFAEPVACLDVVDPLIAGIPEGRSLLGRKISPLSFSGPVQLFLSLIRGLYNRSTFLTYYAATETPRQVPLKANFSPMPTPNVLASVVVTRPSNETVLRVSSPRVDPLPTG
jgi:hypothetical protein